MDIPVCAYALRLNGDTDPRIVMVTADMDIVAVEMSKSEAPSIVANVPKCCANVVASIVFLAASSK